MADYAEEAETDAPEETRKLSYPELMQAENIVDLLSAEEQAEVAAKVVAEYDIDEASRKEWLEKNAAAIDLAMMVATEKDYPFRNASNVKYPLVANAALQFNARAYPAICPPDRAVKGKTYGNDDDGAKAARAERVSEYMSWQLLSQMPEWEEDSDRLTVILPIVGSAFRKVFFDPSLNRNVTRLVTADRLVFNYWARSFNDLPRITELLTLYPYEIRERINDGRFAKFDYSSLGTGDDSEHQNEEDSDGPHVFLEQHRLLDLDGDGYPEPYVVTVHKASNKVCRIKANWTADTAQLEQDEEGEIKVIAIRRQNYFVRYLFLPSPDGGAYGLGFGWLLSNINESINTTLNQTFDAAHLANIQGGFINSALGPKLRNQTFRFEQGEFKFINTTGDLRQSIMPITYPGPSAVLMTLLEFLINSGKELASIKDVLTGDTPTTAPVGTTAMLIDQGLMVFTSIYKRIHRALKEEFKLLFSLNADHVSPEAYAEFFDEQADPKADFDSKDLDINPVSDPQSVTKAQKIAKAQAIYGLAAENPAIDKMEATRRVLEAVDAEDIDKLLVPPPPPDPMIAELTKRAAIAEVEAKEGEAEQKNADATAKLAGALKTMAETGQIDAGQMASALEQWMQMITTEHSMENDLAASGQGGVPGMAGQPGNPMGNGAPTGGAIGAGPAGGGEPVQLPPEAAAGMGVGPDSGSSQQGVL